MQKIITKYILVFIACFALACDKILDVTPRQSIDSSIALESPEAIEAALNAVYAALRPVSQYGRDLIAIPELLSDNAEHTNNPNDLYSHSRNLPGAHMNNWQSSYYAINAINNILRVLDEETPVGVTNEFKERISGQAYFLRALFYHNLMRIYAYDPTAIVVENNRGGVPILTRPTLKLDDLTYPSRASISEVYALIYEDLGKAVQLLDGKTIGGTNPEFYASSAAASALFSRVALYNGDYEKVIEEAGNVLATSAGKFQSNANYINAWRASKHPESLFELVYLIGDNIGVNESLRATFTSRNFLTSATFANRGNVVVSADLMSKYVANDVRRQLIINGLGRNNGKNEMTKFLSKNGTANLDNVPVIRISEVYLNRAEAFARATPAREDLARQDLNMIRERAGLTPVAASLSGQDLINEILLQRRIELAFEGHRFFDLKRLGMDIIKPSGNVLFQEYRILAPI
ncbi:MAG TPA: RagB/SusD family nutrient uptake outer membrane protein, partial [Parasegetibacter sp.]